MSLSTSSKLLLAVGLQVTACSTGTSIVEVVP